MAHKMVAGLESPPGQAMRLQDHGKDTGIKKIILNLTIFLEKKMENTYKSNPDFGTIAWGAIFILWGITQMIPSLPDGTGAVGIGIILIVLNLARSWAGQPTSGFTTTLGILALLLGGLELARPLLHISFELPIFAILLVALGVILLGNALKGRNDKG